MAEITSPSVPINNEPKQPVDEAKTEQAPKKTDTVTIQPADGVSSETLRDNPANKRPRVEPEAQGNEQIAEVNKNKDLNDISEDNNEEDDEDVSSEEDEVQKSPHVPTISLADVLESSAKELKDGQPTTTKSINEQAPLSLVTSSDVVPSSEVIPNGTVDQAIPAKLVQISTVAPSHDATSSKPSSEASPNADAVVTSPPKSIYEDRDFETLENDPVPVLEAKLRFARMKLSEEAERSNMTRFGIKQAQDEHTKIFRALKEQVEALNAKERGRNVAVGMLKRKLADAAQLVSKGTTDLEATKHQRMKLDESLVMFESKMQAKLKHIESQLEKMRATEEEMLGLIGDLTGAKEQASIVDLEKEKARLKFAIEEKKIQTQLSMVHGLALKDQRSKEFLMQLIRKKALDEQTANSDPSPASSKAKKQSNH